MTSISKLFWFIFETGIELGEQDWKTRENWNYIARVLKEERKFREALLIYALVYSRRNRYEPFEYFNILNARISIAETLIRVGRHDEALSFLHTIWDNGSESEDFTTFYTPTIKGLIATALRAQGKLGALEIYKAVYDLEQRNGRVLRRSTAATTLHNLGITYFELQRFDDSLSSLKRAYELWKSPWRENREILCTRYWIGAAFRGKGELSEAREIYETVYVAQKRICGSEHPDTLTTLHSLGITYFELQRFDESLSSLKSVYKSRAARLGKEHPDTLSTGDWIATVLKAKSKSRDSVKTVPGEME
jgi:tetratricopeptide (TPR) repeat protein